MSAHDLADRFRAVRRRTMELCAPLSVEDHNLQPMPDASPAKWHLAHTTWFFEQMVLAPSGAKPFDPHYHYLFNSYYEELGPRVERARRGMLSRPALADVHAYRRATDDALAHALARGLDDDARANVELGLHHEQQHQELILTDSKYALGTQPLRPAYRTDLARPRSQALTRAAAWTNHAGGIAPIGATPDGFAFDNERPRHDVLVRPYRLAVQPLANADVLAFIAEGGYQDHRHWLSDGWHAVRSERLDAPLYWERVDGSWVTYDLAGVRAVDPAETACHLSYYEADALARWLGARLPTEAEWELAAAGASADGGNFADDDRLHPSADGRDQLFGDVWEWTQSAYAPYPGFRPLAGALGEYNGKFMSGQQVLRGGSCFTPRGHVRTSYRNFFPPGARWQMSGVRLAADD